ncbi:MAG: efflux RND transporter periplasmic adaptor subunit [Planctomycetota bacterium]
MNGLQIARRALPTAAVVLGVLVLVGGTAVVARSGGDDSTVEARPLAVSVAPVRWLDSIEIETRYRGEIQARQRIDAAFELAGKIEAIYADEGDLVRAGDPIAGLDTARLRADRDRLGAALEEARADLSIAEITLERTRRSYEADAVSEQEMDQVISSVASLTARVGQAESALALVEVDLSKSTIVAPFDGFVADRHADVGAVMQPGVRVLSLLETESPEVRIGVAPRALAALGDRIDVVGEGRTWPARVVSVLPSIDRRTRTAEVRLALEEPLGGVLRDGGNVSIRLRDRLDERGFWVPLSALTQSNRGLWALYVVTPADEGWILERREVELIRPEAVRAYVRGPVAGGELIVEDGTQRIVPGIRVRPVESEAERRDG